MSAFHEVKMPILQFTISMPAACYINVHPDALNLSVFKNELKFFYEF